MLAGLQVQARVLFLPVLLVGRWGAYRRASCRASRCVCCRGWPTSTENTWCVGPGGACRGGGEWAHYGEKSAPAGPAAEAGPRCLASCPTPLQPPAGRCIATSRCARPAPRHLGGRWQPPQQWEGVLLHVRTCRTCALAPPSPTASKHPAEPARGRKDSRLWDLRSRRQHCRKRGRIEEEAGGRGSPWGEGGKGRRGGRGR